MGDGMLIVKGTSVLVGVGRVVADAEACLPPRDEDGYDGPIHGTRGRNVGRVALGRWSIFKFLGSGSRGGTMACVFVCRESFQC